MALGSFIGAGRSLDAAYARVERAEELGYESVYVTHIAARDSITLLTAYASRTSRVTLGKYFSLPYYRAMIERSGFDPDAGPTEEFIRVLAAIGSRDEAIAAVRAYHEAGATSPCVGGIPGTDFDGTLEALAGALG